MTAAEGAPGEPDRSQATYEEIRRLVLTGSVSGGRHGLVVLLRDGVAGWLARRSICSDSIEAGHPPDQHVGPSLVPDGMQTGMVCVLASMVLGGRIQSHTGR